MHTMSIHISKYHIDEKFSIEDFVRVHEEIDSINKIIFAFFMENDVDVRHWKPKRFIVLMSEFLCRYIKHKDYTHYEKTINFMNINVEKYINVYSRYPMNNINKWFSYRQQNRIESKILDIIAELM
jgi:hypothetical protein